MALVLSIGVLAAAPSAGGAVAALEPVRDATLYQSADGGVANGGGQHLFIGRNSGGNTRRSRMRFDVGAAIPAGAVITGVTLEVSVSSTSGGATSVGLHRVLTDWSEGPSDPDGSEGGGAAALPGDATWLHTSYGDAFWAMPGGDFEGASVASAVIDQPGDYSFLSTPAMVALVQSWLDDPAMNFGWIVVGDESGAGTAKRLDSRENPDVGVRPRLIVTYVPAPGGGVLACGAAGMLLARRRRPDRGTQLRRETSR